MNKRERVVATLNHQEPDTVPVTEMAIDPVHLEAVIGARIDVESSLQTPGNTRRQEESLIDSTVRGYRKLGFELIPCETSPPDGWSPERKADGSIVDEWGRILSYDPSSRVRIQTSSIFKSPEEFENYAFPDPDDSGRTFGIENMKKKIGDEIAIAGVIRDPFVYAWEIFRVTDFVKYLYTNPSFLGRIIGRITDFNVAMIKRMIDAGVDVLIGDGDYCEKKGPLVPTKFFKDVVFPNLERQVQACHKAGLKFIKHTDGNINPILQDLARVVDGLHSLDPTAGVNLGDVKKLYGDKLVLMGNVSVDNLCRGSVQDIIDETKSCLQAAAQGGGYVLSSSNSWYTNAKLDNCLAMVETGRKYGRYPINL